MNDYHQEQFDAHRLVRRALLQFPAEQAADLRRRMDPYLALRQELDDFQRRHLSAVCTENCYRSRLSACCSREGIITFFADVVVNAVMSSTAALQRLETLLQGPPNGFKCVYLSDQGCRWQVRPIVCALFLCDAARQQVLDGRPDLDGRWRTLGQRAEGFKWPDRPVLFDEIEALFIERGLSSPLMYLHNSPGLLRVKQRAGLTRP